MLPFTRSRSSAKETATAWGPRSPGQPRQPQQPRGQLQRGRQGRHLSPSSAQGSVGPLALGSVMGNQRWDGRSRVTPLWVPGVGLLGLRTPPRVRDKLDGSLTCLVFTHVIESRASVRAQLLDRVSSYQTECSLGIRCWDSCNKSRRLGNEHFCRLTLSLKCVSRAWWETATMCRLGEDAVGSGNVDRVQPALGTGAPRTGHLRLRRGRPQLLLASGAPSCCVSRGACQGSWLPPHPGLHQPPPCWPLGPSEAALLHEKQRQGFSLVPV